MVMLRLMCSLTLFIFLDFLYTHTSWYADKLYRWHTGYPGGLKQRKAADMLERKPEEILKKAILGMMRRTNQRHKYIEPRLKIYAGEDHPHKSQLPDGVQGLPPHPRSRSGDHHFGLGDRYASEGSYQRGAGQSD